MNTAQLYKLFLQYPSIQTDTRRLKNGDLYFALKGPNFNGNRFAIQALEQGAAYAIIDEMPGPADFHSPGPADTPHDPPHGPAAPSPHLSDRLILVPDVLQALQDLAGHHRMQFRIPFIAITGSNGKTTTKELIHAVLSSSYTTYTTQGNLNNHIGVPLTILSIKTDAQFAVIEMGANHLGEIAGYCKYTRPTHGIITNAGKAHLEGFGGPEGVKKGKGELYDFLRSNEVPAISGGTASSPPVSGNTASHPPASGTAFVMWDYDYFREMSRGIPHILTYGTHDADYIGVIRQHSDAFLHVDITRGAATGVIDTQLVGDYNLPNVLVAVAVGKYFDVSDDSIRRSIGQYTPSNSRSQLIERDGNHIILDAYNANPSSMKAAIENFARLQDTSSTAPPPNTTTTPAKNGHATPPSVDSPPKKILILGAMAELGEESLEEHRGIVDLIRQYPWQQVLLVGGDFLRVDHPWLSFENARQAGEWLKGAGLKDAYILVKGSRSMKMEEAIS